MTPAYATVPTQPSNGQPALGESPPTSPRTYSIQDTPHASTTSNPPMCHDWEYIQEIQSRVNAELDRPGGTIDGGAQFTKKLFVGEVAKTQITEFLRKTRHYANGRWVGIPVSLTNERDMYKPLTDISNDIFTYFSREDRRTVLSGTIRLGHNSEIGTSSQAEHIGKAVKLKSAPDLVIIGKGRRNLNQDGFPSPPVYDACISMLEVKLESNVNFKGHRNQIGVYVRQCFAQQVHRMYVYTVLINQNEVQILLYDRAGVIYSNPINYHEHPEQFILWICGISSSNLSKIGFDTSIYWSLTRRMLDFADAETKKRFQLLIPGALFRRLTLVGRGTICWIATAVVGSKEVLVKQYWRSIHRPGEDTFLRHLKGLPGIAEILGYQYLEKVSSFRLIPQPTDFRDRVLMRIMMRAEGGTIDRCESQLEIVETLRDAVHGHWNAWKNKILHRDVNNGNILRGKPEAEKGYRGILSDFDMAIWTDRTESLNGVDIRTGDRTFQSISTVLNPGRPHDHRDDLQSFFWVATWIGVRYDAPRQRKSNLPDILQVWGGKDARLSALERRLALEYFDEIVVPHIGVGFSLPFINLLRKLRNLVWAQCHEANKPYFPCMCPGSPTTLEELCPNADEDYIDFLSVLDEAIEEVEEEEARKRSERERKATGMPHLRSHSSDTKAVPSAESKEESNKSGAPTCPKHPEKAIQRTRIQTDPNTNPENPILHRPVNPLPRRSVARRVLKASKPPDLPQPTQAPSTAPEKSSDSARPKKRRQAEADGAKRPGKRRRSRRRSASPPQVIPESPRLPDIRPQDARPPPPVAVSPGGHVFLARSTRSMNVSAYSPIELGIDPDTLPISSPIRGHSEEHQPFTFTFRRTAGTTPAFPSTSSNRVRTTRNNNLPRPLSPVTEVDGEEQVHSVPPSSPENSTENDHEDPA
ncbi:hypothetical protein AX16_009758 [Volvariella volvacea WC 439]|nr:hypothetical protein AX16_009758 [Volvariella volvacea WC 439]